MRLNFSKIENKFNKLSLFKEASSSSVQINNNNLKNFIIKQVGWNSESDDYTASENDLSEVKTAIETDSYIKVALDKTFQLILKAGYKLTSNNESAVEYLKQRLRVMEFGTGVPFDILLEETARNLVYYSNCFWVKSRVDKIQGGLQAKAVLSKKPVGGFFIMDPTAVEIKRGSDGTISNYKLTGTEEKEFAAADVVHFYVDRDASNNFGTPRVISSLEDVKILRKIEGSTLSLIYRFAIPLYQMIIGLPEQNFMATNQEITEAQDQVNKMPMDGIIVTNERTAFKAIGAEGKAIELEPYLSYYEKRVFTALNVSEAMMGRGGSKQDADSMEGLMHDTVKYFQNMISIFIETGVFNEILLEGGFNPIFNEDDIVKFEFNEINLDTKVKMENHVLNKFQGNIITFDEARRSLGLKADNVDESRFYSNMITTASAIEILNAKAAAESETGDGNITNGKTQSVEPNKTAKNTITPTNQHGTSTAKIKESIGFQEKDSKKTAEHIKKYKKDFADIYKLYKNMGNDIAKREKFSKTDAAKYTDAFITEFESVINEYAQLGYKNSQLSGNKIEIANFNIKVLKEINKSANKSIKNLIEDIAKRVNGQERNIMDCFSFMEYRLRFACEFLSSKAYWYGIVSGYKDQGVKKLKIKLSDNHSQDHDSIISTDNFNINQIPPYSPYCACEVEKPEVSKKK